MLGDRLLTYNHHYKSAFVNLNEMILVGTAGASLGPVFDLNPPAAITLPAFIPSSL